MKCIFCDFDNTIDALRAHSGVCPKHPAAIERDALRAELAAAKGRAETAENVAAAKIAEADARGAIAVNCAKALSMLAEGKISEDVAVGILNSAETHMLRACEWLTERDAGMLKAVEEAQSKERYWKSASELASKERDALRTRVDTLEKALNSIMIGGNHLASALIHILGAGKDTFPLHTCDPAKARSIIGDPIKYDLWVCWQRILQARDATTPPEKEAPNGA
jgi:hypothetical protein